MHNVSPPVFNLYGDMKELKVLNLYAGIGGNRRLWEDVEVTALENDKSIAKIYSDNFPNDTMIIGDAHQYLLDHYNDFDFIWASPPCPTHSKIRFCNTKASVEYPDMKLYQEILLLQHRCKGKWVIENVIPYYEPLISANKVGRHLWWSNFLIGKHNHYKFDMDNTKYLEDYGLSIKGYKLNQRRDKVIRNCVHPETGLYILNCARNIITKENIHQIDMFNDLKIND